MSRLSSSCVAKVNQFSDFRIRTYDNKIFKERLSSTLHSKAARLISRFFYEDSELKQHMLMPALYEEHFILLWFTKEGNNLYLIDSSNIVNDVFMKTMQNRFRANFNIANSKSLKFDNMACKIIRAITQADGRSCGVCACIAARVNCTSGPVKYPLTPSDFRRWMIYELEMQSKERHPNLFTSKHRNKALMTRLGLLNVGQTCWFNSVIQAVTACVSIDAIQKYNDLATGFTEKIVSNLLLQKKSSNTETGNAVDECNIYCKFTHGQQECAFEFFSK